MLAAEIGVTEERATRLLEVATQHGRLDYAPTGSLQRCLNEGGDPVRRLSKCQSGYGTVQKRDPRPVERQEHVVNHAMAFSSLRRDDALLTETTRFAGPGPSVDMGLFREIAARDQGIQQRRR